MSNTPKLFTGMAQGQRAGLITPRSLDRNGFPVLFITCFQCFKTHRNQMSGSVTINRVGMDSLKIYEKFCDSSLNRNHVLCIISFQKKLGHYP